MVSDGVPVNPSISNLFSSKRYPFIILDWGTGLEPVVLASRFTAFASFTEGRFNTASLVTKRFLAVWEVEKIAGRKHKPKVHGWPVLRFLLDPKSRQIAVSRAASIAYGSCLKMSLKSGNRLGARPKHC